MSETASARSGIAAVLFDFDGVIVDSAALKTAAFVSLYDDAPESARDYIELYQIQHAGISRVRKIAHFEQHLFGRPAEGPSFEARVSRYGALVEDAVVACSFVPGAPEALELLQAEFDLHVISGTPHEELHRILARRGLTRHFRSIVGSPTLKADAFAAILDRAGLTPDRAVAVGDSLTEYEAAASLGINFVAICYGAEKREFPAGVPVLPDLRRLHDHLRGIGIGLPSGKEGRVGRQTPPVG